MLPISAILLPYQPILVKRAVIGAYHLIPFDANTACLASALGTTRQYEFQNVAAHPFPLILTSLLGSEPSDSSIIFPFLLTAPLPPLTSQVSVAMQPSPLLKPLPPPPRSPPSPSPPTSRSCSQLPLCLPPWHLLTRMRRHSWQLRWQKVHQHLCKGGEKQHVEVLATMELACSSSAPYRQIRVQNRVLCHSVQISPPFLTVPVECIHWETCINLLFYCSSLCFSSACKLTLLDTPDALMWVELW